MHWRVRKRNTLKFWQILVWSMFSLKYYEAHAACQEVIWFYLLQTHFQISCRKRAETEPFPKALPWTLAWWRGSLAVRSGSGSGRSGCRGEAGAGSVSRFAFSGPAKRSSGLFYHLIALAVLTCKASNLSRLTYLIAFEHQWDLG